MSHDLLRLRIDDLNASGDGVARHEGRVVFVRGAVPGDLVEAVVERDRGRFLEARSQALLEPAETRVAPPCPHQPRCGGCPLMVLDHDAALELKVRHVDEVLRRVGGLDARVGRVLASPQALGYRGRVRFAVAPRSGAPRFGYRPRGKHEGLVAIDRCHLAPPAASELAASVLERTAREAPRSLRAWPRQLEMRGSHSEGAWLAVLHTPPAPWPGLERTARRCVAEHEALAGVLRLTERRGAAPRVELLAGRGEVQERVGRFEVPLGATGFLQVNPAAAGRLYEESARLVRTGGAPESLLDLYCGAGLIGLHAAEEDTRLLGIEGHPGAVAAARRVAAGRAETRFQVGEVGAAAQRLVDEGVRFEVVTLNPPRAGAGEAVVRAVGALAASRVVVVSCHPAALARDLAGFVAAGLELRELTAVDLFPQTPHIEVAALLVRPGATS